MTGVLSGAFGRARLRQALPLIVIGLWGSAVFLSSVAMRDIGPMAVAFWRWSLALGPLWCVLLLSGQRGAAWVAFRRQPLAYSLLGLVGMMMLYGLQNLALRYTTVFNTTFLINLTPIFIVLMAFIWLHERPHRSVVIGMVIGLAGAVALSGGKISQLQFSSQSLRGDALAMGSALAAAVYIVYSKRMLATATPLVMLTLAVTMGVLGLLPVALAEGAFWPRQPLTWLSLLALGLGAGALGNLWWVDMLTTTPASRTGLYLYATGLVGALLAVVVLNEPLTIWIAVGGALILVGVWLVQRPASSVSVRLPKEMS